MSVWISGSSSMTRIRRFPSNTAGRGAALAGTGTGGSVTVSASSLVATRGSVTVNVEPSLSRLATEMLPPMASTSRLVIARPSPVPSYLRVREVSAW